MSAQQHSRQRERERIQRERQQASGPRDLSSQNQVSTSLFGAPIKQEHEDETTKRVKNTLGDFDQVQLLLINDHKPLIGISTREITRIKGHKARIEQILTEMKQTFPPISNLDDLESMDNDNGRAANGVSTKNVQRPAEDLSLDEISDEDVNLQGARNGVTKNHAHNSTASATNNHGQAGQRKRKSSEINGRKEPDKDESSSGSSSSSSSSESDSESGSSSSSDSEDEKDDANPSKSDVSVFGGMKNSEVMSSDLTSPAAPMPPSQTPKSQPTPEIGSWNLATFMDKKTITHSSSTAISTAVTSESVRAVANPSDNIVDIIDAVARGNCGKALTSDSCASSSRDSSPEPLLRSPSPPPVQKKRKSSTQLSSSKLKQTKLNQASPAKSLQSSQNNKTSNLTRNDVLEEDDLVVAKVSPVTDLALPKKAKSGSVAKSEEITKSSPRKPPQPYPKSDKKENVPDSKQRTIRDELPPKSDKLLVSINLVLLERVPGREVKNSKNDASDLNGSSVAPSKEKSKDKCDSNKKTSSKTSRAESEERSQPVNGKSGKTSHNSPASSTSSKSKVKNPSKSNSTKRPLSPIERKPDAKRSSFLEGRKHDLSSPASLGAPSNVKEEPRSPAVSSKHESREDKSSVPSASATSSSSSSRVDRALNSTPVPSSQPPLPNASANGVSAVPSSCPPSSLPGLSSNSRSDPGSAGQVPTPEPNGNENDFLANAKKLKHAADRETDRTLQLCKYLEAVLYFILTGNAMEQRSVNSTVDPEKVGVMLSMYKETLNLLRHISTKFAKSRLPHTEISTSDHKLTALSYRCQSLLFLKLSRLKQKEVRDNQKVIASFPDQTPTSSTTSLSVPTNVYSAMQRQLNILTQLQTSHDLWQQADLLIDKHMACKAYFQSLDNECGALSLNSCFDHLVNYVRTGLRLLMPTGV